MASKKALVNHKTYIEEDEAYLDALATRGCRVVEVVGWAGDCQVIHSLYRKVRKEFDDAAALSFLACKSDSIEALEKYRGKSQPCFLVYRVRTPPSAPGHARPSPARAGRGGGTDARARAPTRTAR